MASIRTKGILGDRAALARTGDASGGTSGGLPWFGWSVGELETGKRAVGRKTGKGASGSTVESVQHQAREWSSGGGEEPGTHVSGKLGKAGCKMWSHR